MAWVTNQLQKDIQQLKVCGITGLWSWSKWSHPEAMSPSRIAPSLGQPPSKAWVVST